MQITEVPRAVLKIQYSLARIPLGFVEHQLAARLSPEASARLLFERSLGTLDATVGRLLGDSATSQRGEALIERSETLGRAAALDAEAIQRKAEADAKLDDTRQRVASERRDAVAEAQQKAKDARTTAEERKRAAEQDALQRVTAEKQKADETASERIQAAEAAKQKDRARVKETERAKVEAADAKIEDAKDKRKDAFEQRVEANRIESLAKAEKEKRQAARKAPAKSP